MRTRKNERKQSHRAVAMGGARAAGVEIDRGTVRLVLFKLLREYARSMHIFYLRLILATASTSSSTLRVCIVETCRMRVFLCVMKERLWMDLSVAI